MGHELRLSLVLAAAVDPIVGSVFSVDPCVFHLGASADLFGRSDPSDVHCLSLDIDLSGP
jgi:hypothetical protein